MIKRKIRNIMIKKIVSATCFTLAFGIATLTTTINAQEPTAPPLTPDALCTKLLAVYQEKASKEDFDAELKFCLGRYDMIDKTVFNAASTPTTEASKIEATYFCDLYRSTWLPADKLAACTATLENIINKDPKKRLLVPTLPDQEDEPKDPYSTELSAALGITLSQQQKIDTNNYVLCDLSVFIFSRMMPDEFAMVVGMYGSLHDVIKACFDDQKSGDNEAPQTPN